MQVLYASAGTPLLCIGLLLDAAGDVSQLSLALQLCVQGVGASSNASHDATRSAAAVRWDRLPEEQSFAATLESATGKCGFDGGRVPAELSPPGGGTHGGGACGSRGRRLRFWVDNHTQQIVTADRDRDGSTLNDSLGSRRCLSVGSRPKVAANISLGQELNRTMQSQRALVLAPCCIGGGCQEQQWLRLRPGAAAELAAVVLPLRVSGRFIIDSRGRRAKLAGVNWEGGHLESMVPNGLDRQPLAVRHCLTGSHIAAKNRSRHSETHGETYYIRIYS